MEKSKLELAMTSFVMSHFSYCPLVWMFHNRKSYNKINKIHERALRIIHNDRTSNLEGLLIKRNSVSVHQRNLQLHLIEICENINDLNPSFMAEVFVTNVVPHNIRGSTNLVLPKARTNLSGLLANNYGRLYRKKSKIPRHWGSSKELLRSYSFIAAANYAKVLL